LCASTDKPQNVRRTFERFLCEKQKKYPDLDKGFQQPDN